MKRKKTRISLVSKAVQTSARGQIYIYNKKNTPFVFIRHQRVRIKSAIHLTILRGKMSPVRCLSLSAFSIYDRVYLPQITFLFTYSIKMCVCVCSGRQTINRHRGEHSLASIDSKMGARFSIVWLRKMFMDA